MLNKKIIVTPDNNFHAYLDKQLKLHEPVFSNILNQPISFIRGGEARFKNKYVHYFGIKNEKKIIDNLLSRGGIVWCNLTLYKTNYNNKLNYQITYMQTRNKYRKHGLQELLQAIVCDTFEIKELRFVTTYRLGEKYIQNSSLFSIKEVIPHILYPDILCTVDLEKCRELIKTFK